MKKSTGERIKLINEKCNRKEANRIKKKKIIIELKHLIPLFKILTALIAVEITLIT